jgi:hypothetical protein
MAVECWAAPLGGCGGGTSREHIISKSQFDDDKITVSGLPWCKEPKTVGLASLVAKNLCRNHNTELSPVDAEAKRLKDALSIIYHKPILSVRVRLDARLIERWLLKTTINLALQEPGSGIDLSEEIVRRAFGQATTPQSQGFFAVAHLHQKQTYKNGVKFESLQRRSDGKLVVGGFNMHGWHALYAFDGAPPVSGAMRVREWNYAPHWLRFRWRPEFEPDDSTMPSLPHDDHEFEGAIEALSRPQSDGEPNRVSRVPEQLALGSAD